MLKLCKQTYVTNINITHPVNRDIPFCPRWYFLAQYLSHLLSSDVHVPDNYSSIWATGNELTSVRSITQALHFITVTHTDTNIRTLQACFLNSYLLNTLHQFIQCPTCVPAVQWLCLYGLQCPTWWLNDQNFQRIKPFAQGPKTGL